MKSTDDRIRGLVAFLGRKDNRELIEASMVGEKPWERLMGEVAWSVLKNPEILGCDRESIPLAVAQAAEWDLRIGERAYLIPRYATPFREGTPRLTAMLDWHGEITLLKRYRIARHVDVQLVYETDKFVPTQGMKPWVEHTITNWKSTERGPLVAAYAWARLSLDDRKLVVLDAAQINEIRRTWSETFRMGALDEIPWYAKKSPIHLLAKELAIEPLWKRAFNDASDFPAFDAAA